MEKIDFYQTGVNLANSLQDEYYGIGGLLQEKIMDIKKKYGEEAVIEFTNGIASKLQIDAILNYKELDFLSGKNPRKI